jgi:hypothetical protein
MQWVCFTRAVLTDVFDLNAEPGRAIAQAVSRWLPTATALVRALSGHAGFVVNKVALGQVFFKYVGFPYKLSFHQILHPHNHPGQTQ